MITTKLVDRENIRHPGESTQMDVEFALKRVKLFEKRIKVVIDSQALPSPDAIVPPETRVNAYSSQEIASAEAKAPAGTCMNAFSYQALADYEALAPAGNYMDAFSSQELANYEFISLDEVWNYLFECNLSGLGAYGSYESESWKEDKSDFFHEIIDDFYGFKPYEYPLPSSILRKTNASQKKRCKKHNRRFRRGKSKKNIFLILLLKRVRKALFVLKVQLFKAINLSNLQYLYIPDFSKKYEFIDMTNSYKEDVEFITTVKNSFNYFKSSFKNGHYKKRHKIPEAA